MKQISIRQLVKQSKDIEKFLPCEVTRDGEVIATLISPIVRQRAKFQINGDPFEGLGIPPYDVKQRKGKAYVDTGKLTELPLSKGRQARHSW